MLAGLRSGAREQQKLQLFVRTGRCLRRRVQTVAEANSDLPSSASQLASPERWLFVDSVFPVRFGTWDLRHYIGLFREENLIGRLKDVFSSVKTHGFEVLSLEPRSKDGGVFVKFKYDGGEHGKALEEIVCDLKVASDKLGGLPSWTGMKQASGDIWVVEGNPWREDLHRFASPMLKVAFDGPDIREESLYEVLRPFGRIIDLTPPSPGPPGALRSSVVTFRKVRSAATAHNCIHGITVPVPSPAGAFTRLHTMYERPLKAHAVRDWLASHPKIVMPILFFFLGTLTYTIFDPIRVFAVEARMLDWFDYKKTKLFKWLRANTVERLSFALNSQPVQGNATSEHGIWKDRQDAEADIQSYLADFPSTVTFVHGPQGSGKSRMLYSLMEQIERPVLIIDCADLYKANSDSALLVSLAHQTGYWPVFPFINSLNNVIDIASVGLIGQKAGLSTSLEAQVQQMLEVVGTGLKGVSTRESQRADRQIKSAENTEKLRIEEARRHADLLRGTWHDGRLDCVAGNGVMSELGIGDELMTTNDYDVVVNISEMGGDDNEQGWDADAKQNGVAKQKTPSDTQKLRSLPIVIIKNFATKRGKDDVIGVLAKWAATLVNNQVAHVIVVSDNRENAKALAQALPSKPLHSVALSDADSSSALSFVLQKLHEGGNNGDLASEEMKSVEKLGGRASDLETLVHKVRSGQRVEDAVEDIITRGVSELRKNAFGEDAEDAKNLPWTREQAWAVMRQLTKSEEISYHELLMDFPFKGDEAALRNMEHADLITIGTHNGRPSTIRPGRPVYRYVFERLVADPIFRATQDIASNEKRIASAESSIRSCEDELLKLHEIGTASAHWWSKRTATAIRASYLTKKMQSAEATLEKLEVANAELKKTLAKSR